MSQQGADRASPVAVGAVAAVAAGHTRLARGVSHLPENKRIDPFDRVQTLEKDFVQMPWEITALRGKLESKIKNGDKQISRMMYFEESAK